MSSTESGIAQTDVSMLAKQKLFGSHNPMQVSTHVLSSSETMQSFSAVGLKWGDISLRGFV